MGKVQITYFKPREVHDFTEEQFLDMECYLELRRDYDKYEEDYGNNPEYVLRYLKEHPGEEFFLDRGGWQLMPKLKVKYLEE